MTQYQNAGEGSICLWCHKRKGIGTPPKCSECVKANMEFCIRCRKAVRAELTDEYFTCPDCVTLAGVNHSIKAKRLHETGSTKSTPKPGSGR